MARRCSHYSSRCAFAVVTVLLLAASGSAQVRAAEVVPAPSPPDGAAGETGASVPRRTVLPYVRIASWDLHDLWHQTNVPLRAGATVRSSADFRALRDKARSLRADVVALQGIGSPRAARMLFPARQYFVIFSRELAIRQQRDRDILTNPARRRVYNAIAIRRAANVRIFAREQLLETADPSPSLGEGRPQGQSALAVKLRINKRPVWVMTSRLLRGCGGSSVRGTATGEDNPNARKAQSAACTALRDQAELLNVWKSRKVSKKEEVVLAVSVPDDAQTLAGNATVRAAWRTLVSSDPDEITAADNKRKQTEARRGGRAKRFVLTNPIIGSAQASSAAAQQPRTVPLTGPSRPAGKRLVKRDARKSSENSNFVVEALSDFAKAALGEKPSKSEQSKTSTGGDGLSLAELSVAGLAKLAVPGATDGQSGASEIDGSLAAPAPEIAPLDQANAPFLRFPRTATADECAEGRRGASYLLVNRSFHQASSGLEHETPFADDAEASLSDGARTDCAAVITIPRSAS